MHMPYLKRIAPRRSDPSKSWRGQRRSRGSPPQKPRPWGLSPMSVLRPPSRPPLLPPQPIPHYPPLSSPHLLPPHPSPWTPSLPVPPHRPPPLPPPPPQISMFAVGTLGLAAGLTLALTTMTFLLIRTRRQRQKALERASAAEKETPPVLGLTCPPTCSDSDRISSKSPATPRRSGSPRRTPDPTRRSEFVATSHPQLSRSCLHTPATITPQL